MSAFQDLRRLFNGVSLVAKELLNSSQSIKSSRNGDFQTLISASLKKSLVSATDLAGLTKGKVRELSNPRSKESVVYFSEESPGIAAATKSNPDEKPNSEALNEKIEGKAFDSESSRATHSGNERNLEELRESGGAKDRELEIAEEKKDDVKIVTRNSARELEILQEKRDDVAVTLAKRRKPRERRVPSTPFSRALGFAGLGAGLAWGTIQESAKRIVFGVPDSQDKQSALSPLLSEQNAERLALALCRMRGAALKLGQMLSIQDESLIPAPGFFSASRGLRQGDPLSPLLFLMIGEALSQMLIQGEQAGLFKGPTIPGVNLPVSHIQFADDTLIMVEAIPESVFNLHTTLRCFEAVSGLTINMSKSRVFSVNCSDEELSSFASILGCSPASFPTVFVGLPLALGSPPKHMWDRVVVKFQKLLASWKGRYLSIGGRITLIKAALSNVPIYFMSLFRCPAQVLVKLDNLRRDFLWCGKENHKKIHLMDWKEVCSHFKDGGASIRCLKAMNRALLGKWSWRLATEPDALWNLIIKGKYGTSSGGWWTKASSSYRASAIWKGILRAQTPVLQNIGFVLGNGAAIRFWEDHWIGESALKNCFPNIYRIASLKDCPIQCFYSQQAYDGVWDIRCLRNLNDWEVEEYANLLNCIAVIAPIQNEADRIFWKGDRSGTFSVRSLYRIISPHSSPLHSPIHFVWKIRTPPKYICFAWLAARNRILTVDNLRKRGMQLPNICLCCMKDEETTDHLLVHCTFISSILLDFLNRFGTCGCNPQNASSFLAYWHGFYFSKSKLKIWRMAVLAIWWAVWTERNDRVFNNLQSSIHAVGTRAKHLLFEWAANVPSLKGCDLLFIGL